MITEVSNLLPKDGQAYYFSNFLTNEIQEEFFLALKKESDWIQEELKLFGKKVLSPRLTCYYGEKPYTYSGLLHKAKPYPKAITTLLHSLKTQHGLAFNSVLLNYYRDGQDSMGWHQDNEKELGKNPVIASVNLGETRKFSFKHLADKTSTTHIDLEGGSLLIMKGTTQHYWKHQLPKTKKEKGERINITFRSIIE